MLIDASDRLSQHVLAIAFTMWVKVGRGGERLAKWQWPMAKWGHPKLTCRHGLTLNRQSNAKKTT